jgi:hypothetical protein
MNRPQPSHLNQGRQQDSLRPTTHPQPHLPIHKTKHARKHKNNKINRKKTISYLDAATHSDDDAKPAAKQTTKTIYQEIR